MQNSQFSLLRTGNAISRRELHRLAIDPGQTGRIASDRYLQSYSLSGKLS